MISWQEIKKVRIVFVILWIILVRHDYVVTQRRVPPFNLTTLEFPHDPFSRGTNLAGFGQRNCHFFL